MIINKKKDFSKIMPLKMSTVLGTVCVSILSYQVTLLIKTDLYY